MYWQAALGSVIADYFSETDIEAFCADMGIDYEELAGDTKAEKVTRIFMFS